MLGVFVAPGLLDHTTSIERTAVDVVDAVLGVLLVALAVVLFLRRHRPAHPPALTPRRLLGLGVVMMLTNVSTLVLVVAAMREIVRGSDDGAVRGAVLAVVIAIALVPIWLPLLADVIAPSVTQRLLVPLSRVVARHGSTIGAVAAAAFGCYLVVRSLTML